MDIASALADLVEEIKARIGRFYEELMHLVDSVDVPRDRVYQVGVQAYPLAKPASVDEKRQSAADPSDPPSVDQS